MCLCYYAISTELKVSDIQVSGNHMGSECDIGFEMYYIITTCS